MALTHWLMSRKKPGRSSRSTRRPLQLRPGLEPLETRVLPSTTPIMISVDALGLNGTAPGLGDIASMAVSPDGHKVYLGRGLSTDSDRFNLAVVTLDDAGKPIGQTQFYPDSTIPLRLGDFTTVQSIVV